MVCVLGGGGWEREKEATLFERFLFSLSSLSLFLCVPPDPPHSPHPLSLLLANKKKGARKRIPEIATKSSDTRNNYAKAMQKAFKAGRRCGLLRHGAPGLCRTSSGFAGRDVAMGDKGEAAAMGDCFVKGSGPREMALALELAKAGKRVSLVLADGSLRTIIKSTPSSDDLMGAVADAPLYSFPDTEDDAAGGKKKIKKKKITEEEQGRQAGRAILCREYSMDKKRKDDTGYDGRHQ